MACTPGCCLLSRHDAAFACVASVLGLLPPRGNPSARTQRARAHHAEGLPAESQTACPDRGGWQREAQTSHSPSRCPGVAHLQHTPQARQTRPKSPPACPASSACMNGSRDNQHQHVHQQQLGGGGGVEGGRGRTAQRWLWQAPHTTAPPCSAAAGGAAAPLLYMAQQRTCASSTSQRLSAAISGASRPPRLSKNTRR